MQPSLLIHSNLLTMNNLNIEHIVHTKHPHFFNRFPRFVKIAAITFLEKVLCFDRINQLLSDHREKNGFAFIDAIFEQLDFCCSVSCKDRQRIPAEGRLVCVANHPLGALDALAILRTLRQVRPDVKVIANDLLLNLTNLADLFLAYDISSRKVQKENVVAIGKTLENEEAVVVFPGAEVARLGFAGVKESPWQNGAVHFAKKHNAPILPIFVKARNSPLFYAVSFFSKRLSMFLLPREVFVKRSKKISLIIGDPIPAKVFSSEFVKPKLQTSLLKKHLFRIGKNKKGVLKTETTVIHPTDGKTVRRELRHAEPLGCTHDGKQIFLVDYSTAPNVMREIGRLREITFRRVGEGTGKNIDIDQYDRDYRHIVLWDDDELEIAGAYRIGVCKDLLAKHGVKGLYTSTLFYYDERFVRMLPHTIELGRSFVQQKYWNSRALDYLWRGIGAFLAQHPEFKFMFGGVSISNAYPTEAKDPLVYFYKNWFKDDLSLATAKHRYAITPKREAELQKLFADGDFEEAFAKLKSALKQYGFSVPMLYKQYSDLCEDGGVRFMDFGVDKDFENCVDGLILVEIEKITAAKKERYIYKQTSFDNNGWKDHTKGERHAVSLTS